MPSPEQNTARNASRLSYQSWLPGSASRSLRAPFGRARRYGPHIWFSYRSRDAYGYTSSPPRISIAPRGMPGCGDPGQLETGGEIGPFDSVAPGPPRHRHRGIERAGDVGDVIEPVVACAARPLVERRVVQRRPRRGHRVAPSVELASFIRAIFSAVFASIGGPNQRTIWICGRNPSPSRWAPNPAKNPGPSSPDWARRSARGRRSPAGTSAASARTSTY